jgi:Protein of unknown function, DUF547
MTGGCCPAIVRGMNDTSPKRKDGASRKPSSPQRLIWLMVALAAAIGLAAWHFWPREPIFYAQPVAGGAFDHAHKRWAGVLAAHVNDGRVNYRAIHDQPAALRVYLGDLSAVPYPEFQRWPPPQRLAFLINLYNAATVKLVADHWPVDKLTDIRRHFKGPRQQRVVRLFGRRWTLDELENQWIKKHFSDPRVDATLCRATRTGPSLRSEPYFPSRLETQLQEQASAPRKSENNDAVNGAL